MRDPLHIPWSQLTVSYNGKEVMILNKRLLDQQNCWDNLEKIKNTFVKKFEIYELINSTDDAAVLKRCAGSLRDLEFELQGYFKFTLDGNFHRIWEYPKCKCPKLDNRERYPHGHVTDSRCPLHGDEK